jgi:hypothetical protein
MSLPQGVTAEGISGKLRRLPCSSSLSRFPMRLRPNERRLALSTRDRNRVAGKRGRTNGPRFDPARPHKRHRTADEQVLYLTTIGRTTGLPREIEILVLWSAASVSICSPKRVEPPDGLRTSGATLRSRSASQNGKLTRWRVCWTVKPIANCGTKWLQSPIANMDGRRAAGGDHAASLTPHAIIRAQRQASRRSLNWRHGNKEYG